MLLKWEYLPDRHRRGHGREKDFVLDSVLDETWSYLFGYFIGDGYIESTETRIAWEVEEYQVSEFKPLLEAKFGMAFSCVKNTSPNASIIKLRLNSVGVVNFLHSLDFRHEAHNKIIPDFLLRDPVNKPVNDYITPELTRALLQGLFDSDGTNGAQNDKRSPNRHGFKIAFGVTSEILAKQVYALVTNLGMTPSLCVDRRSLRNPKHHDFHLVQIQRIEDALTFHRTIGFRIQRKQALLEQFLLATNQIEKAA